MIVTGFVAGRSEKFRLRQSFTGYDGDRNWPVNFWITAITRDPVTGGGSADRLSWQIIAAASLAPTGMLKATRYRHCCLKLCPETSLDPDGSRGVLLSSTGSIKLAQEFL